MSELLEQHSRWSAARERLWPAKRIALAVEDKSDAPIPESPFKRMERQRRMDLVAKAVRNKPDLAVIFPDIFAHVEAGYLPSSFICEAGSIPMSGTPRWKAIALEVAAKHGVRFNDLLSTRRNRASVAARHEAFWRCREETNMTLPQIGRMFGGRDHSTVTHGIQKHEKRMGAANAR